MYEEEELVTNRIGRKFWIYKNDSFYQQRIALGGPFQQHNLRRLRDLVPNARIVLDIGMNIGMNTIEYATWAKKVIGFEPTPQTFDMANRSIELAKQQTDDDLKKGWYPNSSNLNGYASCKIIADIETNLMGLGDTEGSFKLHLKKNNAGQNHLDPTKIIKSKVIPETIDVNVKTVDSFNFSEVDIIKIDTEGFEFYVIKGAEKTILIELPVIQVEMIEAQFKRFNTSSQEICDWFTDRDFIITLSDGTVVGKEWSKVKNKIERFFIHKSKFNNNLLSLL